MSSLTLSKKMKNEDKEIALSPKQFKKLAQINLLI